MVDSWHILREIWGKAAAPCRFRETRSKPESRLTQFPPECHTSQLVILRGIWELRQEMRSVRSLGLAIWVFLSVSGMTRGAVSIDYVAIGNIGNSADPYTGCGAVDYSFQIGKFEVTNAQYAQFLNQKAASDPYFLYATGMSSLGISRSGSTGNYSYLVASGYELRPVVLVSWYDAARFCNWLGNGQGNGDTETGAYTLNGAMTGTITANPGATIRLPTDNEWYKSAYFNGSTATYSIYPNGQNSITVADANFSGTASKPVGSYPDDSSYYGTFDQGGNVAEWNDFLAGSARRIRGGAWADTSFLLRSNLPEAQSPGSAWTDVGFRIVSIPEIQGAMFPVFALMTLCGLRRRPMLAQSPRENGGKHVGDQ